MDTNTFPKIQSTGNSFHEEDFPIIDNQDNEEKLFLRAQFLEKKRIIFKIEKEEVDKHESSEESENIELKEVPDNNYDGIKRISAYSKVNFSKLKKNEKDERLKNLAKLVKRLRRKVRNLEKKLKYNANKVLSKYLSHYINDSYKTKKGEMVSKKHYTVDLSLDKLCKSIKCLKEKENFEYEDQKDAIENFINLIAEEKLPLDSINFRKICTQIRLFLDKEKVNSAPTKKGQIVTFSFPERDVLITAKEYEQYSMFKDKEDVIRVILGINNLPVTIYPEKINFEKIPLDMNMKSAKDSNKNLIINQNQENSKLNINNFHNNPQDILNNVNNLSNIQKPVNYVNLSNQRLDLNFNDVFPFNTLGNKIFQNYLINSVYSNALQNNFNNCNNLNVFNPKLNLQ